jgi:hypothetical protein
VPSAMRSAWARTLTGWPVTCSDCVRVRLSPGEDATGGRPSPASGSPVVGEERAASAERSVVLRCDRCGRVARQHGAVAITAAGSPASASTAIAPSSSDEIDVCLSCRLVRPLAGRWVATTARDCRRAVVRSGRWCGPGGGAVRVVVRSGWWCGPGGGAVRVVVRSGWWCGPGGGAVRVVVRSGWWCGPGGGAVRVVVRSGRWCGPGGDAIRAGRPFLADPPGAI